MNLKVLFFVLLNIIIGYIITDAKLTVAYVTGPEEHEDASKLAPAKIRQALIESAGADSFKQLLIKKFEGKHPMLHISIGKDCDLILESKVFWDEESMLMVKRAMDYLSEKNDTLIFSTLPITRDGYEIINECSRYKPNKLIVGKFFQEDLNYFVGRVFIVGTVLGDDYEEDCKKYGHTPFSIYSDTTRQEDLDFYFDYLLKTDKKILSRPLRTKPKVTDYSYKYDERAGIRYIQEHIIKRNEIPDQNKYILPIETLDINVEDTIDEILNALE